MARSVAEILESAGRAGNVPSVTFELQNLRREWEGAADAALPFLDFLPIRIVSLIEKQVRDVITQAIDHGDPYASRAFSMLGTWSGKSIVEAFSATAARKITLGRLISFSFSVGRLEELLGTLSRIFGDGFRQQLAQTTELWSEDEPETRTRIIPDIGKTLGVLDQLFRQRHVLVHEAPIPSGLREEDVAAYFEHALFFAEALGWILIAQTRGHTPKTQYEMNKQAGDELRAALSLMYELRGGDENAYAEPKTHADQLEHHWDKFARLSADVAAGYDKEEWPGTIAPLLYASELEELTKWRVEQLRRRAEGEALDL